MSLESASRLVAPPAARLDAILTLARKHRVEPAELPALNDRLQAEYDELAHADERGRELEQQLEQQHASIAELRYQLDGDMAISRRAALLIEVEERP